MQGTKILILLFERKYFKNKLKMNSIIRTMLTKYNKITYINVAYVHDIKTSTNGKKYSKILENIASM